MYQRLFSLWVHLLVPCGTAVNLNSCRWHRIESYSNMYSTWFFCVYESSHMGRMEDKTYLGASSGLSKKLESRLQYSVGGWWLNDLWKSSKFKYRAWKSPKGRLFLLWNITGHRHKCGKDLLSVQKMKNRPTIFKELKKMAYYENGETKVAAWEKKGKCVAFRRRKQIYLKE